MGCDYYVDTFLYVYYNNTDYPPTYINLSHDKRYIFLSDDPGEDSYKDLKEKELNYNEKPIVIYSNKTFNEPRFEDSYKHIIEYNIQLHEKTWSDIKEIKKMESRYAR